MHVRGIFGFEGGDFSGIGTTGGTVTTAAKRPGGSAFGNWNHTNSAATLLPTPEGATTDLAYGDDYDFHFRFHFQANAYPGATNFVVARAGTSGGPVLQMDTTGHIRLVTTVGNFTTGYTAQALALGMWYRADIRVKGYVGESGTTTAGRRRETCDIYDAASGTLIVSLANPDQDDFVNASSPQAFGQFIGPAGSGTGCPITKKTVKNFVVSVGIAGINAGWIMAHTKTGGVASDLVAHGVDFPPGPFGDGTQFDASFTPNGTSEFEVSAGGCGFDVLSFTGKVYETGTLTTFGDSIKGYRLTSETQLTMGTFILCSTANVSRDFYYDDVWYDLKTKTDVDGSQAFPTGTVITLNTVTAQGPVDQFSPAGQYTRIQETPLASGTVAGTFGQATDYEHLQLNGNITKVEHVRVYANMSDGSIGSHFILFAGVQYATAVGVTLAAGATTCVADRIGDMVRGAFNDATVGVQNNTSGHTLTLGNLYMEVLNGPTSVIDPIILDACVDWVSPDIEPGTDTLSPVDSLFEACDD